MRTTGPGCQCGCVILRDGFDGADTKLNGVTGDYSGIPNRGSLTHPDQFWVITGGRLLSPKWDGSQITTLLSTVETTTLPAGPYRVERLGTLPRNVKLAVDVHIPYESTKARLVLQLISAGSVLEDRRYGVEIETSGTVDSTTECGWVRLYNLTDLLSPVLLDAAKVVGLSGSSDDDSKLTLCLCFNPDSGVLNGFVQAAAGGPKWVHAFGQTAPSSVDASLSKIWMEVISFPTSYSGSAASVWWDNLYEAETAKKESYYYYYYGGHTNEAGNSCPCCGADGCQSYFNDFTSGVIDCDFFTSGSVTVDSSGFATLPTSGSQMKLLRSWSGANSDCDPDKTMAISAGVKFHGDGKTMKLEVMVDAAGGNPYALFTSESAPGARDGTIELFDKAGITIDSRADVSIPKDGFVGVALCYYDGYLVASTRGALVEGESGDSGDGRYGRIVNMSSVELDVTDFYVTHDLYAACPDCFGEELPGGFVPTDDDGTFQLVSCPDFPCSSNKVPLNLKLTVFNGHCAWQDDGFGGQIEWTINGTTLLPFVDEFCSPYDFTECAPPHIFASFDNWVRWSAIMPHTGGDLSAGGGGSATDVLTTDTVPCGPEPFCVSGDTSPRVMSATPIAQVMLGAKDGVIKVVLIISALNFEHAFCLGSAFGVYEATLSGTDCLHAFDGGLSLKYVDSFVCCNDGYLGSPDQFCKWSSLHPMLSR